MIRCMIAFDLQAVSIHKGFNNIQLGAPLLDEARYRKEGFSIARPPHSRPC